MEQIVLQRGISLLDLETKGQVLEINTDFHDAFEDSSINRDNNNDTLTLTDELGKPVDSFEELSKGMTHVDQHGLVKKKVLEEGGGTLVTLEDTVTFSFSGYFENESTPFDSTPKLKPLKCNMLDSGLLPGLQTAILSMKPGETAQFILSYKVMYGVKGVPPRIKPKSDTLFYIKLMSAHISTNSDFLSRTEGNVFQLVHKESKRLFITGYHSFKNGNNIPMAIRCFLRAVNMLQQCRLADENEEKQQLETLKKLYYNLAICYNHSNQPLRACTMCNEYNRLDSIWNNDKILLQNARAYIMINEFKSARKCLLRASKLCPDNEAVQKELDILDKKYNQLKEGVTFLIPRLSTEVNDEIEESMAVSQDLTEEFKCVVGDMFKKFSEDNETLQCPLPEGLNSLEFNYINDLCHNYNYHTKECGGKTVVSKNLIDI